MGFNLHHLDPEVDKAFIRLLDDLCQFERATSRGGLLLYIPENKDEMAVVAFDGKPVGHLPPDSFIQQEIESWFTMAMSKRYDT